MMMLHKLFGRRLNAKGRTRPVRSDSAKDQISLHTPRSVEAIVKDDKALGVL